MIAMKRINPFIIAGLNKSVEFIKKKTLSQRDGFATNFQLTYSLKNSYHPKELFRNL